MNKNPIENAIDAKRLKKVKQSVKWEVKKQIILSEIAKGLSFHEICEKYKGEWGCTYNTMQNYIKEAAQDLYNEDMKESLKQINMFRLDSAYGQAVKEGDLKTAIKAVDTQNKMIGAYEQKVTVDTDGDIDVTFNF